MILAVTANPILRDLSLLLISFVLILGTLYVYFRLRAGTFRRTRKLLQERVEVKTKQLSTKNLELEKLSLVASKTDNSVIIADHSGKIEWVNDGFTRMTGQSKEILGRGIEEIGVYQNVDKVISDAIIEKHSKIFESHVKRSDGKEMWISSTLTPIFEHGDTLKKLVFVDTDITESKKMEQQIIASLKEKDVLLKEIHHRVKNNLQIIISLLNLQSGYIKDEETLKAVREGQNRVRSMALVHEKFYQADELAEIDFGDYTEKLVHFLRQSYGDDNTNVEFSVRTDGVTLDMDHAMPCGMLVTEIVSNSLKYAFPNHRPGKIDIEMKKYPGKKIMFSISDNGIGLPANFDIDHSDTLGMQLIGALAKQVDGEVMVSSKNGAKFSVTFTYPKSPAKS
jgi:PAS domain S-box-containing protein